MILYLVLDVSSTSAPELSKSFIFIYSFNSIYLFAGSLENFTKLNVMLGTLQLFGSVIMQSSDF